MFWSKNKKNRFTPAYPSFFYIKVGFKGVYIARTYFPDVFTSELCETLAVLLRDRVKGVPPYKSNYLSVHLRPLFTVRNYKCYICIVQSNELHN